MRQPRVVLVVEAVEVEPATEVPPTPPEDEHAGPLRDRSVEPGVQALHQVGRQRVGAVRPVELEDERGHAAPQSASTSSVSAPSTGAARSIRLGTPPMRAG